MEGRPHLTSFGHPLPLISANRAEIGRGLVRVGVLNPTGPTNPNCHFASKNPKQEQSKISTFKAQGGIYFLPSKKALA
jgi:hypothetical protein